MRLLSILLLQDLFFLALKGMGSVFPSVTSAMWAPPELQSRASRACISSCRARGSVIWERLLPMRVTVGPYSPRRIGDSRTVPAVLTRHLHSRHLQSSPITCRARRLPVGPVRPGRPLRYCRLSCPPPKTGGLDAWEG